MKIHFKHHAVSSTISTFSSNTFNNGGLLNMFLFIYFFVKKLNSVFYVIFNLYNNDYGLTFKCRVYQKYNIKLFWMIDHIENSFKCHILATPNKIYHIKLKLFHKNHYNQCISNHQSIILKYPMCACALILIK